MSGAREVDVAVIGAGQAGLSGAYFLGRAGFRPDEGFAVLDHSPGPGGAWQFRWPSLTYAKAHGVHDLPGLPLTGADPARPSAEVVSAYFDRYERAFDLRVHRPVNVSAVRKAGDGRLLVETDAGTWSARALINASGTWDRPFLPHYPGQETFRGRQLHTAGYRGAAEFTGKRVIVVGGGTSAVQLLMELAEVADTTWVTRRPPLFRSRPFDEEWGRAAIALVEERVRAGLPPQSVVSVTGLAATEAVRAAQARGILDPLPVFDRVTEHGVAWNDGRELDADVILWATGFRAALDHLAPLRLREPGGGIRLDGTTRVAKDPRIHLIGYGPSASTIGANRAGRTAVREIRRFLATGSDGSNGSNGSDGRDGSHRTAGPAPMRSPALVH
ncbi:NAD(P)-binding domain-containing protein [Streptomyces sp. H10-C2]|uniref:NAD(P)-binding domain-containing protein n=1 Tax=unclassified Streptomyces TaxID=2593676 RepID=UPI0024B95769|nr:MULTISPECIES: NAD(P)-binding domain-containing protein [unclassified Streptomyces]MDJ0342968.1 NAD(P)-binding domain-containing protein [Streptomyces sp. PH10-H1]MDJ0371471.1 NAD(P)-binding domain-containing protein [Streptomyces sp. H10-C2]